MVSLALRKHRRNLSLRWSRYYYDSEAIKVPLAESTTNDYRTKNENYTASRPERGFTGNPSQGAGMLKSNDGTANKRSVWTVTTKPYSEAHFATFPPDLIEPCILAGCPEWVCKKCGKARVRIVEKQGNRTQSTQDSKSIANQDRNDSEIMRCGETTSQTTGWTDCGCGVGFTGGIYFDPFMGSGTTAMVAYENRRNYVGCELNPEYIKLNRADKAKAKYALFDEGDVM